MKTATYRFRSAAAATRFAAAVVADEVKVFALYGEPEADTVTVTCATATALLAAGRLANGNGYLGVELNPEEWA